MSEPHLPPRPALPPAFQALICAFAGNFCAVHLYTRFAQGFPLAVLLAAVLTVQLYLLWAALRGDAGLRLLVCVLHLSFWMSFVLSCALLHTVRSCAAAMEHKAVSAMEFRVISGATPADEAYRVSAEVYADGRCIGEVRLSCPDKPAMGSRLKGVGVFRENADDDWGRAQQARGVAGNVRMYRCYPLPRDSGALGWIHSLREAFLERVGAYSGDAAALLAGIAAGERYELVQSGLSDDFSHTGMAHMLSVSGAHLSCLATMLSVVLHGLGLFPAARLALSASLSGVFVLFCGEPASAVRSWLMSLISGTALVGGRRSDGLSSLGIVALCMALLDPGCFQQTGFVLSVLSVSGICLFAPYFSYALDVLFHNVLPLRRIPRKIRRKLLSGLKALRSSVAMSLSAMFLTLPVCMETFGEFSPLSPVFNAAMGPVFSLCVLLCFPVLLLCAVPALFQVVYLLFFCVASPLCMLVRALGRLPFVYASVDGGGTGAAVVVAIAAVALFCFWPSLERRQLLVPLSLALLLSIGIFLYWRFFCPARVVVLDIGQGDAIAVQEGDSCVLVDAGPADSLAPALSRNHIYHLDAIVISHLHDDHYGGIPSVLGRVDVDRVLVAKGVAEHLPPELAESLSDWQVEVLELELGDVLCVGNFSLDTLGPTSPVDGSENAHSLLQYLYYSAADRRMSGLFTGDAEQEQLQELLERADVADIDFLKVGHHGSEISLDASQARILSPALSVASAAKDNSYGHPSAICRKVLEDAGSLFLCTADYGDIYVFPGREGVDVAWRNIAQSI